MAEIMEIESRDREELYLNAIARGDVTGLPDPQTREEIFLYAIASGDTSDLPDPQTRYELFLTAIAERLKKEDVNDG